MISLNLLGNYIFNNNVRENTPIAVAHRETAFGVVKHLPIKQVGELFYAVKGDSSTFPIKREIKTVGEFYEYMRTWNNDPISHYDPLHLRYILGDHMYVQKCGIKNIHYLSGKVVLETDGLNIG